MTRGPGGRIGRLGVTLTLLLVLSGCGGGGGNGGVASPSALSITTASVPNAVTGTAYQATLLASGGTSPYTWALATGSSLPAGLSLSASGAITGTPTSTGTTSFTVTVNDAGSPVQTQSKQLSLTVVAPLSVTTSALPDGVVNATYSATLAATGGTAPYTWSLATGSSLPAGLSLSASGAITGTPTSAGTTNFTVTVTDASSPAQTQSKQESIAIGAASTVGISITNPSGGAVSVPLGGTQSLVASVTGTSNTSVSWSVAGEPDGNSTVGSIVGGTATTVSYHAPTAMPPGNPLTVTATSRADSSKTASLVVTLAPVAGKANPVVAVGAQQTHGINLGLASLPPALGLADVGTCTGTLTPTLNVSCGTNVTGISAAPGATVIVWALGQGLTSSDGSSLAAGLQVNVSQGAASDVTITNLMPGHPQSGLSSIYFQMQINSSATLGLRDLIVSNAAGELQHFVGAIQITTGP